MSTNYQELSVQQLKDELLRLRREQFNLRMQRATGQAPRPHQFGVIRKLIARAHTYITQKLNADTTKVESEK